ncbi:hypothetical protein GW17_00002270 [Ensete ventricosum]|uniref:Uncharacterized protein n=1 Tax=Ensete ventricosum TaxID=4639 RepID=A0A427AL74_ENSVE|nr:hypothetical protein B296_00010041 [Ensete ventricosum]RWW33032.1 hypothetical protein GW17_00002270 [Ensete ventricosum]RZR82759.1 hypothetical protein BHM03_00009254 [Ensete ventricosum]
MESLFTSFLPRAPAISMNPGASRSDLFGGTRKGRKEALISMPRRRAAPPGIICMTVVSLSETFYHVFRFVIIGY